MVTSLLSVVKHFDGVQITVKPLKPRLSRKEKESSIIAAKIAESYLSDHKNKLTILSLLYQLGLYGTAIGVSIDGDVLLKPINYKSYVKSVTKRKPARKTS